MRELLGVSYENIVTQTQDTRGAHSKLKWLKDEVFLNNIRRDKYQEDMKVHLLHLVGCFIMSDKSHTLVNAKYLFLFYNMAKYDN